MKNSPVGKWREGKYRGSWLIPAHVEQKLLEINIHRTIYMASGRIAGGWIRSSGKETNSKAFSFRRMPIVCELPLQKLCKDLCEYLRNILSMIWHRMMSVSLWRALSPVYKRRVFVSLQWSVLSNTLEIEKLHTNKYPRRSQTRGSVPLKDRLQ